MEYRNPDCARWHQSREFLELVRSFHDNCARCPSIRVMKEAKAHFTVLNTQIRDYMSSVSRIEFQGSSYEGIKVTSSDLEFDCLVILKGGNNLLKEDVNTIGFAKLRHNGSNAQSMSKLVVGDYMSNRKVPNWFTGELQKTLNALGFSDDVLLVRHGPAVQMDINYPGTDSLWYSVDMVPGYEVPVGGLLGMFKGTERYVAKSYAGDNTMWRQSFSIEEKELMRDLDKGSGCRKMCVRMLKVIREIDDPLGSLLSYFIKTTLLNMARYEPNVTWTQGDLGIRFVQLLGRLSRYLSSGVLPHHFLPEINLMSEYDKKYGLTQRQNMAFRLERLLNSEQAMRALLATRLHTERVEEEKAECIIL